MNSELEQNLYFHWTYGLKKNKGNTYVVQSLTSQRPNKLLLQIQEIQTQFNNTTNPRNQHNASYGRRSTDLKEQELLEIRYDKRKSYYCEQLLFYYFRYIFSLNRSQDIKVGEGVVPRV